MIPFVDLQAQYRSLKSEIDGAIQNTLDSSQFILGRPVEDFEKAFAEYCGSRFCVATNSGTSALHVALLSTGIGPGDEVITTPFTFVATIAAIRYTGATPVFVDIDPASFTIDPTQVEQAITPQTRAILPVHLYGQPADMDPLIEIAKAHGLRVIEDAAQAHGAKYKNRPVGSIGDLGCFSFYPGKNLGAYGEGGAVTTSDAAYAHSMRMLRDWGQEKKYEHVIRGFNYRMEGLQGAILGVKLRHLDRWNESRRHHAAEYNRLLQGAEVGRPAEMPYARSVYHIYAVRSAKRSALQMALAAQGIQTGIHYPHPVHLLPAHADLGYRRGDFPHAELAADEVLSLPMFPELGIKQAEAVAAVVGSFRSARRGNLSGGR